jgi:16S rRNA (guanine966-N2)-methyltransferase
MQLSQLSIQLTFFVKYSKITLGENMRIIAGKLKGLKLNEFEFDNIRPTIDRVREAIFNKIQFKIPNALVLDLFGGTGAVSLEFVSRYADKVITVDNNPNSVKLIRQNFSKAKVSLNLLEMDYMLALKKLKGNKFDIIFLDPPFDADYGEKAIQYIVDNGLLGDDGVIVYEHIVEKQFNVPDSLEIIDERKYGTIKVTFMENNNG